MNSPWKIVLVLVGIFLAGVVTGGAGVRQWGRDWLAKRPGPEQWVPNHLKRLDERLRLTPQQAELIRPIVRRNMTELNQLRENLMTETKAITERMQHEVSEKLTPDQRVRYEQMNKEQRDKAKKLMQERNARPPGAGAGKAGPVSPPARP